LKTALRLTEYELEIEAKKIYSLVALAAYYNKVKITGIEELQGVLKSIRKARGNGESR